MKTAGFNSSFTTETESQWERERPRKILFVDDDESLRGIVSMTLADAGHEVDTVPDGHSAWGALCRKNYSLLITDQKMPGLTGLELAAKVRAARMTLPVILVSGTLDPKAIHKHRWLNLSATLAKPFTAGELLNSVKEALCSAMADGHAMAGSTLATLSRVESWPHWGLNE